MDAQFIQAMLIEMQDTKREIMGALEYLQEAIERNSPNTREARVLAIFTALTIKGGVGTPRERLTLAIDYADMMGRVLEKE